MSDGLTLKERAETDPVLQRALENYRMLAQCLARDYDKAFRETLETSGLQAALVWGIKMQEAIEHKAAEYEAEAKIPGLAEQYLVHYREERERLDKEFPIDPAAMRRGLSLPPQEQRPATPQSDRRRMSMGEMAARTAVRATVWTLVRDAIRAILR